MITHRNEHNNQAVKPQGHLKAFLDKRIAQRPYRELSLYLAYQILSAMNAVNINQTSLAKSMNVSQQYISKMLSGTENFTIETIENVKSVLKIELDTTTKGKQKFMNPPSAFSALTTTNNDFIGITLKKQKEHTVEDYVNEAIPLISQALNNTFPADGYEESFVQKLMDYADATS